MVETIRYANANTIFPPIRDKHLQSETNSDMVSNLINRLVESHFLSPMNAEKVKEKIIKDLGSLAYKKAEEIKWDTSPIIIDRDNLLSEEEKKLIQGYLKGKFPVVCIESNNELKARLDNASSSTDLLFRNDLAPNAYAGTLAPVIRLNEELVKIILNGLKNGKLDLDWVVNHETGHQHTIFPYVIFESKVNDIISDTSDANIKKNLQAIMKEYAEKKNELISKYGPDYNNLVKLEEAMSKLFDETSHALIENGINREESGKIIPLAETLASIYAFAKTNDALNAYIKDGAIALLVIYSSLASKEEVPQDKYLGRTIDVQFGHHGILKYEYIDPEKINEIRIDIIKEFKELLPPQSAQKEALEFSEKIWGNCNWPTDIPQSVRWLYNEVPNYLFNMSWHLSLSTFKKLEKAIEAILNPRTPDSENEVKEWIENIHFTDIRSLEKRIEEESERILSAH